MLEHSMLYPKTTLTRRRISMDGMWKFHLDERSVGEKILLRFGAATHRASVYVNGILITEHEGGFLPFSAKVTTVVRYDSYNKVVVKVNNELNCMNLPCGETITLPNGKKMSKPYFDFFNYAGLQRSVYLLALPGESIVDFDLDYAIHGKNAEVSYQIRTNGEHAVQLALFDAKGHCVAQKDGKEGVLYVENARLWQVRNAYLYRLRIRIMDGEELIDEYEQEIGIRTVKVEGTDILINGEPVYLKGFGKHEDSDIVGRGFSIGIMKRDFELMKWIGANSFRTSHYPYSEEIYQMADREGFLVIDEVPAVGMFQSLMNFMEASTGKQTAFFKKETTPVLLKAHLRAIEEMIARDKNHPSVVAWSLLNEPETTNEAAVPYFKEVFDLANKLDMQKRPRTFALIMNSLPDTCKCYQFSDIIALNRYYGWYMKGGYEISVAEELFRKEMNAWKEKKLNKPFIFTEYGADTLASEHKLPSVMWSQEYQDEYLKMTHEVFDSYDFIKGEQIWNFADFQTTEGIMRVNGNKKGVFTRQRQPKDIAYKLKERWENLPLDYKK